MGVITRRQNPPVGEALVKDTKDFEFEQAVSIIEAMHDLRNESDGQPLSSERRANIGEGSNPLEESVVFKSTVNFSPPSCALSSLQVHDDKKNSGEGDKRPVLWVNVNGIAGLGGPLPTPYSEIIMQRNRLKDFGFRDFLDIFNHRINSMLYRIRKKFRIGVHNTQPETHMIGRTILQMTGVSSPNVERELSRDFLLPANRNRPVNERTDHKHPEFSYQAPATFDETEETHRQRFMLTYADLLWRRPHSAAGWRQMVASYFNVDAHVLPFRGRWRIPPKSELSVIGVQLGRFNALGSSSGGPSKGQSMILGSKVWDHAAGQLLFINNLTWDQFVSFLPIKTYNDGDIYNSPMLKYMAKLYVAQDVEIRVRLSLIQDMEKSGLRPIRLQPYKEAKNKDNQFYLGLNTWLNPDAKNLNRHNFAADVRFC